jgi:hypothetical protein
MGQAVGTVAALATRHDGQVRAVPFGAIADALVENGAVLTMEQAS